MVAALTLTPGSAAVLVRPLHYLLNVQPLAVTPVNAVAATGSIGTDGTNPINNNTITIGTGTLGRTYTFTNTLTPVNGEVLIGATADDTALNLAHAINATGGTPGTDYQVASAHPTVSASTTLASNRFTITALISGVAGNVALSKVGTHVSVNGATALTGGIDGTVAAQWTMAIDTSYLYVTIAANTIADANWRRIALGNAY